METDVAAKTRRLQRRRRRKKRNRRCKSEKPAPNLNRTHLLRKCANRCVVNTCFHIECVHDKCVYQCDYDECKDRAIRVNQGLERYRRLPQWQKDKIREMKPSVATESDREQMAEAMFCDYVNLVSPMSTVEDESIIDDLTANPFIISDSNSNQQESSFGLNEGNVVAVAHDSEIKPEPKAESKPYIENIQPNSKSPTKLEPDCSDLEFKPAFESSIRLEDPNPFIMQPSTESIDRKPAETLIDIIDITDVSVMELVSSQARNSDDMIITKSENFVDLTADNSVIIIDDEDYCSPENKANTSNKKTNQRPLQMANQMVNTKPSVASTSKDNSSRTSKDNSRRTSKDNNSIRTSTCYTIGAMVKQGLRVIVIDGSNVAFGHTHGKYFSVEGLHICIYYFIGRGHVVKAFLPQFRTKSHQSSNPSLLESLHRRGHVVFTPSREVNGRRIASYDDRFIIQYATLTEGVVVSSDNYRDLYLENSTWRETIEKRLLMPTWADRGTIMFPSDPLGRGGPTLEQFLRYT